MDRYDPKSVFGVPALVVVFFIAAFIVTTVLFAVFTRTQDEPDANPQAVERNSEPLNKRLDRIRRGGEIDQPRLEPLRQRGGNSRAITSPELPGVNSPELHPEDIVPGPERTPALYRTGKDRVSIDEVMKLDAKGLASFLPTQKSGTRPPPSTNVPTEANAGRGAGPSEAHPPSVPPAEGKK